MSDGNIFNRERASQERRKAMSNADCELEGQLWQRLCALDYLSWALGSGKDPELVEALLGPAVLPESPIYADEDEAESPGEREADRRIKALRDRVAHEYHELTREG